MTDQECNCEQTCCAPTKQESVKKLEIKSTSSTLTFNNYWDHFLTRWGYKRNDHRVSPGLYALGNPTSDSPVFVTANYTLSFDALRTSLKEMDSYILVLDTYGVNVWCAAGKGTFGTDELVERIRLTNLEEVVNHKRLILPQLGAPGINATEVKRQSGFNVKYGPVRAGDLPAYLDTGHATIEMRQVRFTLWDRLVLVPMELKHTFLPTALVAITLYLLVGITPSLAAVSAVLAGAALFPMLLPLLPTRDFSSKGFILGGVSVAPFAIAMLLNNDLQMGISIARSLAIVSALPPVTAYLALNFTGSTTFTSKSGVKREMATYIPIMAWMLGAGVLLMLITIVLQWLF